jgi:tetratricopeptide (TPR) repeat protein
MTRGTLFTLAFCLLLAASPGTAETAESPPALTAQEITQLTLDDLFAKLPEHAGSPPGRRIEAEILKRFHRSGSDTADLLLTWANSAIESKNYPLALDVLDQIVVIRPDFAEAWNKRATVHFLMDEYGASIADIRQTLALEPRHFGALAGLGMIFQTIERKEDAIRVFKRALEINPQLDSVRESLDRLKLETAGDSI